MLESLRYLGASDQVLQMMMGYCASQLMAVVARFGLPDLLDQGPRSSASLAEATGADPDAMERLLRAAASVGLFGQSGPAEYRLTPLGSCLRTGVPGSLRDLVIAQVAPGHWLPWGHLYDAVKTGHPAARAALGTDLWEYYAQNPDEGAAFARAMGNFSALVSGEVVRSYDFSRFELAVDVGGSQGALIARVLKASAGTRGILYDRPEVIEGSKRALEAHGLGERLTAAGGSFLDSVPAGADLYLLKSVLHDWDDDRALAILKNVHRAAAPGAILLIIEMIAPAAGVSAAVCLSDLNVFLILGGRMRSAADFEALLARSGWSFQRVVATPGMMSLLEAVKA